MYEAQRSRRLVLAAATFSIFIIFGALSFALYEARNSEINGWREQLSNTTLLLAQQASNEMVAADLVMDGMLERIHSQGIETPAALRQIISTRSAFEDLLARKKGLPQIDVATITDDGGKILAFTRTYPAPDINLADRDYFQAQRLHADTATYVSQPVRNRGNGEWTFYVSRRISGPDGRFIGTVLVGLSSRRMSEFFSKINLGNDATVTLYRRDFTVLARWPHQDAQMGAVNRGGSTYEIVARQGRDHGVIVLDTPRQSHGGARIARMGAARAVPGYPLIINVTVTDNLFMRQWHTYVWQLAGMAVLCSLAVLAVFRTLLREAARRENAMRRQRSLQAEADMANRAKSDFLAMISHEIRTPLTSVIGFAEQLEHARSVEEAAELGGIIARNGQTLLSLINDILDMSKVESGNLVIEQIPFAPGETLDAVRLLMAGQAQRQGIVLEISLARDCPGAVVGDPTRWRQIILNLASNAIKFTERGRVCVDAWYEAAGQRLVCRVSDTGIGMSREQLDRLFRPFEQADNSIARRFGGTGLGLYLVQQLAHAMKGQVTVDSGPGEGTRITLSIHAPVANTPASQPASKETAASQPRQAMSGSVLLVEDNEFNRTLITAMLQRLGLHVSCAEDGERGVALAMTTRPDLVLMDVQMPVLDGLEAVGRLRSFGFESPVIALTANVSVQDRERYQRGGFDACLAKPIDKSEFVRVLGDFLGVGAHRRMPAHDHEERLS